MAITLDPQNEPTIMVELTWWPAWRYVRDMEGSLTITLEHLTRRFGLLEAVSDLSLQVAPGEVYGLLGPNGAGKTTALRILATLLQPGSGRALVGGYDSASEPIEVRRRLGYLTGDTGLYRRLTPVELLRYFANLYGIEPARRERRIEELLARLDLTSFSCRRCEVLSTGERQRVNIARALFHDPAVLVLDEPTAGLDILAAQTLIEYVREERERNKAILFSTHILAEAELLCDRIGVLHRGRLLDEGTAGELCARHGGATLAEAFLRVLEVRGGGP